MKYSSIALSGLPVSGKSSLIKRLSQEYGWSVFSIGDSLRENYKQDPDGQTSVEEYFRTRSREQLVEINQYLRMFVEPGNVVGDSRFTLYLADLPCLRVFMTADSGVRAKRAIERGDYTGKNFEQVRQILLDREMSEVELGHDLFGYDYRLSEHYHLVINSGLLSIEEEFRLINAAMQKNKY